MDNKLDAFNVSMTQYVSNTKAIESNSDRIDRLETDVDVSWWRMTDMHRQMDDMREEMQQGIDKVKDLVCTLFLISVAISVAIGFLAEVIA